MVTTTAGGTSTSSRSPAPTRALRALTGPAAENHAALVDQLSHFGPAQAGEQGHDPIDTFSLKGSRNDLFHSGRADLGRPITPATTSRMAPMVMRRVGHVEHRPPAQIDEVDDRRVVVADEAVDQVADRPAEQQAHGHGRGRRDVVRLAAGGPVRAGSRPGRWPRRPAPRCALTEAERRSGVERQRQSERPDDVAGLHRVVKGPGLGQLIDDDHDGGHGQDAGSAGARPRGGDPRRCSARRTVPAGPSTAAREPPALARDAERGIGERLEAGLRDVAGRIARTRRRCRYRSCRGPGRSRRWPPGPGPDRTRSSSRSTLEVPPSPPSSSNCTSPGSCSRASESACAFSSSACRM